MDHREFSEKREELRKERRAMRARALERFVHEITANREEARKIYERRHDTQRHAQNIYNENLRRLQGELNAASSSS